MDIDRNFEDITVIHQSDEEDMSCGGINQSSGNFDCNICLDSVQDPVVTLCGHLFCWPCIYKWICTQTEPDEDHHHHQLNHKCPVCKSKISHTTLIPIYGRGQGSKRNASSNLGNAIPRRPLGPVFSNDIPRTSVNPRVEPHHLSHEHMYSPQMMPDPVTRVVCEMVYERLFGNSMTNMNMYQNYTDSDGLSRRVRRRMMQADKSLSRIYLFLVCSAVLCLLLF